MFYINDDKSIYITRGDSAIFVVGAENNGAAHLFQPGDVVRFKVTEKKNSANVVLQKEFAVEEETETVNIILERNDTKIGGVISKPVDYWYEVELNPFTEPQTIIGYDEDGAKIFKLFPEGGDVPPDIEEEDVALIDDTLSLTSERPIQNQAVSRAIFGIIRAIEIGEDIPVEEYFSMKGATEEEDGSGGFAPAPMAGEQDFVLHGDGTWRKSGVDRDELDAALNESLKKAKESGEFDGEDGAPGKDGKDGKDGESISHSWNGTTLVVTSASGTTSSNLQGAKGDRGEKGNPGESISLQSVSYSEEDGGENVLTFSDGKRVSIKNGSRGSRGEQGIPGVPGVPGVGISNIEMKSSDENGNTYEVEMTDGTSYDIVAPSGPAGKDGEDGSCENIGVFSTESGEAVSITDAIDAPLQKLNLFGKTVQGTGDIRFDGEMEIGGLDNDGTLYENSTSVRTANFTPVKGGETIIVENDKNYANFVFEYDENKVMTRNGWEDVDGYGKVEISLQRNTRYIKIVSDEMGEENDVSVRYTVVYADSNRTPSVDNPVYPESAGEKGNINVRINEQTFSIATPNGLPGIPDDTDGNYEDENGQKWYCDEIDLSRGVYVQRVDRYMFEGMDEPTGENIGFMEMAAFDVPGILAQPISEKAKVFCSHCLPQSVEEANNGNEYGICVSPNGGAVGIYVGDHANLSEFFNEQYSAGMPVMLWYRLDEPIETPLTEEQLSVFAQMRSYQPQTDITNDENAGMSVAYATTIEAHISKKIAEMPSETWTFTMEDGTTVDKEVVLK